MGAVKTIGGIGMSSKSGAIYIDMVAATGDKAAKPIQQTVPNDILKNLPWSPWGSNNLLPEQMKEDIKTCGILNGIISGKARFALGEGMVPAIVHTDNTGKRVIERIVEDAEIVEFLEMNNHFFQSYGWMMDLVGFRWGVARYMLNGDGTKIAAFQRDDVTEVRYDRKNVRTGRSHRLWYSADWSRIKSPNDERVFSIPLLNSSNPLADLQEKAKAGIIEHALTFGNPTWGEHYYPTPDWMTAYKWVKIAQGVPEMKSALFENSMRPKYKVIIHEEYWDNRYGNEWNDWDEAEQDKKRDELYNDIDDWLVGSKNAYKSIFVNGYRDGDGKTYTDIDIELIEDNTKQGELLPDSAAANSEIAFALLFNPAIIGATLPSGPYTNSQGGSNVRESVLMQIILHEFERQTVRRIMNVVKYFNNWNTGKYKGLEFIIPATVMTTLDTGGSSKPVVTGGINPKEKDGTNNNDR